MLKRLAGVLLLPALAPLALTGPATADAPQPDFSAELAALSAVAACDGGSYDTARFDKAVVDEHCAKLNAVMKRYQDEWAAIAAPFFEKLVPDGLPDKVVYPFGGADLLTALVIYPDFSELTSLSLEAGGDPRPFMTLSKKKLKRSLALHRQFLDKLVTVNHSRTLDLARLKGDPAPSQIVFALVGLAVHGYEPVSLRFFELDPSGRIAYFSAADVAEADEEFDRLKGSRKNRKLADHFGNYELSFKKKGTDGPVQVYRHLSANLADDHLAKDNRALAHLEAKGRVAAMTKAASYLLWWRNFDTIRNYLIANMAWMVSDSTGIPPNFLDADKFEIETYGKFRATAIKGSKEGEAAYRAAWKAQPKRDLPFMFGYPSKAQHPHLVVTRPKSH